jgi:hypothetical protein
MNSSATTFASIENQQRLDPRSGIALSAARHSSATPPQSIVKHTPPMTTLPEDMVEQALLYLSPEDFIKFYCTCRLYKAIASSINRDHINFWLATPPESIENRAYRLIAEAYKINGYLSNQLQPVQFKIFSALGKAEEAKKIHLKEAIGLEVFYTLITAQVDTLLNQIPSVHTTLKGMSYRATPTTIAVCSRIGYMPCIDDPALEQLSKFKIALQHFKKHDVTALLSLSLFMQRKQELPQKPPTTSLYKKIIHKIRGKR